MKTAENNAYGTNNEFGNRATGEQAVALKKAIDEFRAGRAQKDALQQALKNAEEFNQQATKARRIYMSKAHERDANAMGKAVIARLGHAKQSAPMPNYEALDNAIREAQTLLKQS